MEKLLKFQLEDDVYATTVDEDDIDHDGEKMF